jgi:hypothetical protein
MQTPTDRVRGKELRGASWGRLVRRHSSFVRRHSSGVICDRDRPETRRGASCEGRVARGELRGAISEPRPSGRGEGRNAAAAGRVRRTGQEVIRRPTAADQCDARLLPPRDAGFLLE